MTGEKKFKQRVRDRQKRTGESYTTAKKHLERAEEGGAVVSTASPTVSATELQDALRSMLAHIKEQLRERHVVAKGDMDTLARLGHELHVALCANGQEPKHRKYLVKNRRVKPDTIEFYHHIHSAESILRFMEDPHANDDPVGTTIDSDFEFRVFARSWGHEGTIHVRRTAEGWTFRYMTPIASDRDGRVAGEPRTGLLAILEQELINYPTDLPGYFEWLWIRAAEEGLGHDDVQGALTALANWVSQCERTSPGGIFKGYS